MTKIKKAFEEMCDPNRFTVSWCNYFYVHFDNLEKCPRTCFFVVKKDQKMMWEEYDKLK